MSGVGRTNDAAACPHPYPPDFRGHKNSDEKQQCPLLQRHGILQSLSPSSVPQGKSRFRRVLQNLDATIPLIGNVQFVLGKGHTGGGLKFPGFRALLSYNRQVRAVQVEFLQPMIASVRDPQMVLAVQGHALGRVQFAGSISDASECPSELTIFAEYLDKTMLTVEHRDFFVWCHHGRNGKPELIVSITETSDYGIQLAVCENLNTVVASIRNKHPSVVIDMYTLRCGKLAPNGSDGTD
jgi:hypothetical protein